ncbi:MAG: PIN/TRAM domain-containing protein [Leptonema sp. (in: bacteria)]
MILQLLLSVGISLLSIGLVYFVQRATHVSLITGVLVFLISYLSLYIQSKKSKEAKKRVVFSIIGLGIGIFFSFFLAIVYFSYFTWILFFRDWILPLGILITLVSTYAGYMFGAFYTVGSYGVAESKEETTTGIEKVLDSSVIIDGRILKIAKTNFIEGPFIIPNFVLREIQLISDSADPIKRNRGRRGLDLLNELQRLSNIKVKISYVDYADIRDTDSKLIQLTRDMNAKLITNDFNLEKVAEVQGVQVLNLNALTEALRPIVLPGEELKIQVVREGKDENQGIGYLDDGTMVVIEDGKELIGKLVRVNVTSIIQTAAGKMIFTKAIGPVTEEEIEESQQSNLNHQGSSDKGSKGNKKTKEFFIPKKKR